MNTATGTVEITGYYSSDAAARGEGRIPAGFKLAVMTTDVPEAETVVGLFPKSAKLRAGTCGTMREDFTSGPTVGYVSVSITLAANGVNGGANETGVKRIASILKAADKAGLPVVWNDRLGNSYPTLAEFLADLGL
jgi:hypothetical protein